MQLRTGLAILAAVAVLPLSGWASDPDCEILLSPSRAIHAHVVASRLKTGEMREFLKILTGVSPLTSGYRLTDRNSDENRAIARAQIVEIIRAMGYDSVRLEPFLTGANIIVELPGRHRDQEVLEVTAHFDSVVTGGDDNGSGVAVLLGMLSLFRDCDHERTLRFVFSDLEEKGMQGMDAHVANLRSNKADKHTLIGAIVVDTIGWAHPESRAFLGVMEVGTPYQFNGDYSQQLALGQALNFYFRRIGDRSGLLLSPETSGALPGTTDLGAYWRAGIPAVLIAAAFDDGFTNPEYHKVGDTLANMNWEYYHRMATLVVEMTAYAAGMRLRDESQISPREWELAASLENKSVDVKTFDLEGSVARTEALDEKFLGFQSRSSKWFKKSEPETPNAPPKRKRRGGGGRKSKPKSLSVNPASDLTLIMFSEGHGPLQLKRGVLISDNIHVEIRDETQPRLKKLFQTVLASGGAVLLADWLDGQRLEPEDPEKFVKSIDSALRLRHVFTTHSWENGTISLRDLGPYLRGKK